MTDDVQSALESTGGVRVDVGVVGDTDSTGADGSKVEAKVRAVQRQETWVYIDFKMAACFHMALPKVRLASVRLVCFSKLSSVS